MSIQPKTCLVSVGNACYLLRSAIFAQPKLIKSGSSEYDKVELVVGLGESEVLSGL